MRRWMASLALAGVVATLPGCMIALGSDIRSDHSERLDRLEKRVEAAETKLGIGQEVVR